VIKANVQVRTCVFRFLMFDVFIRYESITMKLSCHDDDDDDDDDDVNNDDNDNDEYAD